MPTSGTVGAVSGVISLVLITAVVVLGIGVSRKGRVPGLPARYAPRSRYAGLSLHQNLSLLAIVFLALHILAAVSGRFGGVPLAAVVIPLASGRPALWLGLGAIASDLMAALVVTSLIRRHLGRRAWRAVHWLAYACWPAALAHSVGTGTGMRAGHLLDLAIGCVAAVLVAAAWRLAGLLRTARSRGPGARPDPRGAARWPGRPLHRRPRVSALAGAAGSEVLRLASGPHRLFDGGRRSGAAVRHGLDHPSARAARAVLLRQLRRAACRAIHPDPI